MIDLTGEKSDVPWWSWRGKDQLHCPFSLLGKRPMSVIRGLLHTLHMNHRMKVTKLVHSAAIVKV